MANLEQALIAAGASPALAKVLTDNFATQGHRHEADQIDLGEGLDLDEWGDGIEERMDAVEAAVEIEDEDENT
jgi:hypothetical protein